MVIMFSLLCLMVLSSCGHKLDDQAQSSIAKPMLGPLGQACIGQFWSDCAKQTGNDYKVGWSWTVKHYSIMYFRGDQVLVMPLSTDGFITGYTTKLDDWFDIYKEGAE